MKKKKWILLISVLLFVLAGVVWLNSGSEPPIKIKGDLSARDVAEIKGVVLHELRRRIFPGFSLKNLKELPTNVKNYSRLRIRSIQLFTNVPSNAPFTIGGPDAGWIIGGVRSGAFVVTSRDRDSKNPLTSECFVATKGMTGWGITNLTVVGFVD